MAGSMITYTVILVQTRKGTKYQPPVTNATGLPAIKWMARIEHIILQMCYTR